MTDYCNGIIYGTGYVVRENGKTYLCVRNLDPYYSKIIEHEVPYKSYESKHNIRRDNKTQWCIKLRNICEPTPLSEIHYPQEFIRAYMELHATIDPMSMKDRKGNKIKRLRLRIYGNEEIISWINTNLPAKEKKIQYIRNVIEENYLGETCCIYFQSRREILDILDWIYGQPRNEKVWDKWWQVINNLK